MSPRGFRELLKAGFVEAAVEHVGLFFVAKNGGAQRFIIDVRATSNGHFSKPPSGPLLSSEGLCRVEFQRAPEDAQHWLRSEAFFALLAVLASEVGYTGKRSTQKRLAPDSLIYPARSREVLGFLFFCRDYSTPPLFGSKHGMGSLGFRWFFFQQFLGSGSR